MLSRPPLLALAVRSVQKLVVNFRFFLWKLSFFCWTPAPPTPPFSPGRPPSIWSTGRVAAPPGAKRASSPSSSSPPSCWGPGKLSIIWAICSVASLISSSLIPVCCLMVFIILSIISFTGWMPSSLAQTKQYPWISLLSRDWDTKTVAGLLWQREHISIVSSSFLPACLRRPWAVRRGAAPRCSI